MKFVHAADIHLDSRLRGLEAYEGAPVEEIRGATRRALENLVELCLGEQADLLVLAGDLYDGDWRDFNTGLFFLRQIGRLTREGVRVAWIRGNHDAASQITRKLTPPDGAFELDTRRPETVRLEDLGVALHGQSYPERDVTRDLAAGYPEPVPDLFNIGLLHTALDGRAGHDSYAPCTRDRLVSRGYDYWALGHVHAFEVVHEDPWIVFPGNLQGRHARETGPKGAVVVRVEDGVATTPEHHALDVVRWAVCEVDVSEARTGSDVLERARLALEQEAGRIGDRLLAVRLRLVGQGPAEALLRGDRERWRSELRLLAEDLPAPTWIEKIGFDVRPESEPAALADRDDPIARLARALSEGASREAAIDAVAQALAPLESKLPAELRQGEEGLRLADREALGALLESAERDLRARLLALGDEA